MRFVILFSILFSIKSFALSPNPLTVVGSGGDVFGPASSLFESAALYTGDTGKFIKSTPYALPFTMPLKGQTLIAASPTLLEWGAAGMQKWTPNTDFQASTMLEYQKDLYVVNTTYKSSNDFLADVLSDNLMSVSPESVSTGLLHGSDVTLNADDTKIDIQKGGGWIVDYWTKAPVREIKRVEWPDTTLTYPTNPTTRWYVYAEDANNDGVGELRATTAKPGQADIKSKIYLAQGGNDLIGKAITITPLAWRPGNTDAQLADLSLGLGMFFGPGLKYFADATRTLSRSAVSIHSVGADPQGTYTSNFYETAAQSPVVFNYFDIDQIYYGNDISQLKPDQYDRDGLGGALETVGANKWTIQKIFMTSRGRTFIGYGQQEYGSYSDCLNKLFTDPFAANEYFLNDNLTKWIAVAILKKGATTCVGDAETIGCEVLMCGKFGCGAAGGAPGSAGGDVLGPATATDNAIARYDGGGGKIIQDSAVTISDPVAGAAGTTELKVAGSAIPILRANGSTDNQQAGTLFLSQGDDFGGKVYYDATNSFDGVKLANRVSNVDTWLLGLSSSKVVIPDNTVLEFGYGVAGKEVNAGKIGYGAFTANTLDILGGGTGARSIKLWDNVTIPGTLRSTGDITSAAYSMGAGTSIDYSLGTTGNNAYTTASCGAFTLSGMADGGVYALAIKGTAQTTCVFTYAGVTLHYPVGHGVTTIGKQTLYTFMRLADDIYIGWSTGL